MPPLDSFGDDNIDLTWSFFCVKGAIWHLRTTLVVFICCCLDELYMKSWIFFLFHSLQFIMFVFCSLRVFVVMFFFMFCVPLLFVFTFFCFLKSFVFLYFSCLFVHSLDVDELEIFNLFEDEFHNIRFVNLVVNFLETSMVLEEML
jgi:hypothetical protein